MPTIVLDETADQRRIDLISTAETSASPNNLSHQHPNQQIPQAHRHKPPIIQQPSQNNRKAAKTKRVRGRKPPGQRAAKETEGSERSREKNCRQRVPQEEWGIYPRVHKGARNPRVPHFGQRGEHKGTANNNEAWETCSELHRVETFILFFLFRMDPQCIVQR